MYFAASFCGFQDNVDVLESRNGEVAEDGATRDGLAAGAIRVPGGAAAAARGSAIPATLTPGPPATSVTVPALPEGSVKVLVA